MAAQRGLLMAQQFEESIVDSIRHACGSHREQVVCMMQFARLIKSLPIRSNHDAIKEAILNKVIFLARIGPIDTEGVIEYLDQEKRRVFGEESTKNSLVIHDVNHTLV